jgi:hypothetical protein
LIPYVIQKIKIKINQPWPILKRKKRKEYLQTENITTVFFLCIFGSLTYANKNKFMDSLKEKLALNINLIFKEKCCALIIKKNPLKF